MTGGLGGPLLETVARLWSPEATAQNPDLVASFRPYLFVLLAFAAGWILIGAWVVRIGRKVKHLSDRIDELQAARKGVAGPDGRGG